MDIGLLSQPQMILTPLIAALLAFTALWPISIYRRDVSIVDLVWGPGFFLQLAIVGVMLDAISLHGWFLLILVGVWSARLGVVLCARRWREGHEDARYQTIRASWGTTFWWKSLFIVFVLQAILQWLVVLGPISGMTAPPSALGPLTWLGAAIAVAGLGLETLADRQLDTFKRTAPAGALMTTGLRAHVRHPNYAGEIVFWVGIAAICIDAGAWLGLISPILITVFLTKVSGAPLLDERLSESRPDYAAYRAEVPGFVPWTGGSRRSVDETHQ